MSTLQELQALDDATLIERLAVEVMGWTLIEEEEYRRRIKEYDDVEPWLKPNERRRCFMGGATFNPLTDWNHTMEVVEKFRTQLFSGRRRFRLAWEDVTGVSMTEALTHLNQRDLCLAALLALYND